VAETVEAMKCPKCGYIGFEAAQKCRNCGYDFSLLAEPLADLDLPLKRDEPLEAPADFDLRTVEADQQVAAPHRAADKSEFDLPGLTPGEGEPDLPLFAPGSGLPRREAPGRPVVGAAAAGSRPAPVVTDAPPRRPASPPPQPRPTPTPIPVRTAPAYRPRPSRGTPLSLREAELDLVPEVPASRTPTAGSIHGGRPGGSVARAIAGALDVVILIGLDAAVLYFTLRLCRLSFSEAAILPFAPLVAFFLLLDGAYLIAFTAVGGQTIGKMAASLKVVGEDGTRVLPGQAAMRSVGYVASLLPAGLGFVPGFFGPSRRALHDRLANTRVIRA
jgi:uncharacterized RDD family membrane protein YckC